MDFRTHFLFVHLFTGHCLAGCSVDGDGDLRAAVAPALTGQFGDLTAQSGTRYLIKSFPRSAVKTVDGLPLPKR